MPWLQDLVTLAQDHTWIMVVGIWITVIIGGRMQFNRIEDNGSDIEELAEGQREIRSDLQRVDQKQNHVVNRQEMVMERMGANEQEIQELREEAARMDAQQNQQDRWGGGNASGDD